MAGRQRFEIPCASRGYHVYREIWTPRLGQSLKVEQEMNNVHDPFACLLYTSPSPRDKRQSRMPSSA